MEKTFKRLLSFAVALVMILGMIPVTQFEAKAETTEQTTPTVVAPEDVAAPEHVNDDLPFTGAEGGKAMCYACDEEVDWYAITADYVPADTATPAGHYYIPDSDEELYITAKNKNWFFAWITAGTVCLHLNGNDLKIDGLLYVSSGTFNLMGEGTLTGTYYWGDEPFRGAIHFNPGNTNTGRVNLYGGHIKTEGSAKSAVSFATVNPTMPDPEMNIYDGVEIERFYQNSGTVNMYGGTINTKVDLTNAWVPGPSSSIMEYSVCEFNMFDGAVINGRVEMQKDIKADSTNEDITKNNESVTFNMYGGTVTAPGTKEDPKAMSGGAFCLWEGVTLNIHGGTINGGYQATNPANYGGAIYASRPGVANTDDSLRKTVINMTGGTINAAGECTVNSSKQITAYTVAATCGAALHLYGIGGTYANGGGTEFNMSGGVINGGVARGSAIFADGAVVNLSGNAKIQNGIAVLEAGQVSLYNKSVLNMYDNATITGGIAYPTSTATSKTANGANVWVDSGCVFNMRGGVVEGGVSHAHSAGGGNLFLAKNATLNMYDGEIRYGVAVSNAGGNIQMAAGATMNMYGGTVRGGGGARINVDGDACYGGNIYMTKGDATTKAVLNMYGGLITEGVTKKPGNNTQTWGTGANIFMGGYAEANILGGTISNGVALNFYIHETRYDQTGCFGGGNIFLTDGSAKLTVGKNPETGESGTISGGSAIAGGNILNRYGTVILNEGAVVTGGVSTGTTATSNIQDRDTSNNLLTNSDGTEKMVKTTKYYGGGNIYCCGGTLDINTGAQVVNGLAGYYGGNIYAESKTKITMDGGLISQGDTAGGTLPAGKTQHATRGGNLAMTSGATFNMSAGIVANSTATTGGNIAIAGTAPVLNITGGQVLGGKSIYVPGDTKAAGASGDIDGRAADWGSSGGGGNIYASGGTVNISNTTVSGGAASGGGNILAVGAAVTVNLNEGAQIVNGIATEQLRSDGKTEINAYYRGGNIQASGATVNINKGAVVKGAVAENAAKMTSAHVGKEINAIWCSVINLNGGTIGEASESAVYNIRLDASEASANTTMNFNDGTFYGKLSMTNNVYTYLNANHGVFTFDPVKYDTNYSNSKVTIAEGTAVTTVDGLLHLHKTDLATTDVPASCTADGYTLHSCSYKNETLGLSCEGYKTNSVAAHTQTYKAEVPATCTENGVKAYYACSCGKNYADEACTTEIDLATWTIPANGHAPTAVNGLEATHAAPGYQAAWFCDDCDTYFVDEACENEIGDAQALAAWQATGAGVIPQIAHTYDKQVATDEYLASAATHAAAATYYYSCECGAKGTETFEYGTPVAHTFDKQVATDEYLASAATHAAAATYYYSCECGVAGTETFEYGTPVAHTFDKQVATDEYLASAATHAAAATYYYSCECGAKGEETFSYGTPVAHTFDKQVATDEYLASAATHAAAATYYKSCECGVAGTETFEYGTPVAHTFDKQVTTDEYLASAATHAAAATYYYSCECGVAGTETFEYGTPVAHTFDKEVATEEFQATLADHFNAATYYYSCECGAKGEETFSYGDPVAHTYDQKNTDAKYLKDAATCTAAATYYYSCECGVAGTETFTDGDPIAHTYNKQVATEDYQVTEATCTAAATYFYSCECGDEGTEIFSYGEPIAHTYDKQVATEDYQVTEATCTAKATYHYSCKCGAAGTETFEYGELAAHTLTYVPQQPATATAEGYEAYYKCDCGALFADEKGEEPIEAPAVIAKLPVAAEVPEIEEIVGEDEQVLTQEQKEIIQQIVAQSEQIKKAENLPENTYLKISLSSAKVDGEKVTRVTYKVKPIVNGQEESNPGKKITFYLPVPKDVVKETVAVFHNGVLMGDDFVVQTEGEEKFVIVESDNFSEFTIDVNYVVNAMVGETPYGTLEEALEAAQPGSVVALQKPVSVEELDVPENVTLDLNGQILTMTGEGYAQATFDGSYIIDSSEGNVGRLVMDASRLRLLNTNKYLPVDMGNSIMFVKAVSGQGKNYEADSVYQCWMGDDTDVALMEALKTTDASVLGLKFQVIVSWGTTQLKYTFSDATVKAYAQNWTKLAMYLKLVGAEGIDDLTYQARIVYHDGQENDVIVWSGAAIPHHSN